MDRIIPVILNGGSGTRLWPISRQKHPKQFLPYLNNLSFFQNTVRRVLSMSQIHAADIIVVTHKDLKLKTKQHMARINQNATCNILTEPVSKNTAAAILYAALYSQYKFGFNSVLWITPSDHIIQDNNLLEKILAQSITAAKNDKIVTWGITPSFAATEYGWIHHNNDDDITHVSHFIEKPNLQTAKNLYQSGRYLWNAGIFVATTDTLIKEFKKLCPDMFKAMCTAFENDHYNPSPELYQTLKKLPFDKAILEKSNNVVVIPCDFDWTDIGSWNSLLKLYKNRYKNIFHTMTLRQTKKEGGMKKIFFITVILLSACADVKTAAIENRAGNHERAVWHWHKLADLGVPSAQVSLGRAYLKGEGVEQNKRLAYDLFREGEKNGNKVAIFELARLFEKGEVVPQNTQQALNYYEQSGALGYARGYYYKGKIYERGRLIEKDISKAIENYKKAQALGYERAAEDIAKLNV